MQRHRIVFVIYDGFQVLDLTGPHEVFHHARTATTGYDCLVVGPRAGLITSSSGLPVHAAHGITGLDTADRDMADRHPAGIDPVRRDPIGLNPVGLDPAGIDTLVVAGGDGVYQACGDAELVSWIAAAGVRARRVTSVCSGAFLLAAAGLLSGRTVTTHWSRASRLGREYPDVTVDPDPIFIQDGNIWTSAGVTAGLDLALALVEDDLGRDVAHVVAQHLVLFLRRPGNQSQFSVPLWSAQPRTDPIRAAVSAIQADPGASHGIAELARAAGLSPRHLQRRFTAELGIPPAAYVERVRIEAAQRALTQTDDPVETVARRYGFGTAETLRRAFHRNTSVAPSDYRNRFRSTKEYA
ncbi:MAG TPA: helix-turn-helix domain-containing protein [Streptosporangiaceae bacterium]|nr:helix-turn-helix domain-containing protein [Streptosporangiaceae bacterium]